MWISRLLLVLVDEYGEDGLYGVDLVNCLGLLSLRLLYILLVEMWWNWWLCWCVVLSSVYVLMMFVLRNGCGLFSELLLCDFVV